MSLCLGGRYCGWTKSCTTFEIMGHHCLLVFSRLTPDAADPRKSSSSWHGFAWFFRDFLRMLFAAGVAWFLLVSRGKKSEALFLLRACLGRTRRLAQHHAEMLRDAEMWGVL